MDRVKSTEVQSKDEASLGREEKKVKIVCPCEI